MIINLADKLIRPNEIREELQNKYPIASAMKKFKIEYQSVQTEMSQQQSFCSILLGILPWNWE